MVQGTTVTAILDWEGAGWSQSTGSTSSLYTAIHTYETSGLSGFQNLSRHTLSSLKRSNTYNKSRILQRSRRNRGCIVSQESCNLE